MLDADVRGIFDSVSHEWMEKFVAHGVGDRRVLRLIGKWLKAGVSEDGQWSSSVEGTPQGTTVSPLLANVYVHYVLDLWADAWPGVMHEARCTSCDMPMTVRHDGAGVERRGMEKPKRARRRKPDTAKVDLKPPGCPCALLHEK